MKFWPIRMSYIHFVTQVLSYNEKNGDNKYDISCTLLLICANLTY